MNVTCILVSVLLLAGNALAIGERATLVRVASMYISPDAKSAKLSEIDRGYELVILETSKEWVHVQALIGEEKMLTGWILDRGMVRTSTPDGDKIVYGAAADAEDEASRRHGRRGADKDALRLYYRVYDLFPDSTYAGEGLYRAADIRWQVEKIDVMSRGSAKEKDPYMREGMNEEWMREVMKKFPGTRWADLAAFRLLENKVTNLTLSDNLVRTCIGLTVAPGLTVNEVRSRLLASAPKRSGTPVLRSWWLPNRPAKPPIKAGATRSPCGTDVPASADACP